MEEKQIDTNSGSDAKLKKYTKDNTVFEARDKPIWERISFNDQPQDMSEEDETIWKILLTTVAKYTNQKHVIVD